MVRTGDHWKRTRQGTSPVVYRCINGTIKDVDRRSYRPPASLAEYIQVRNGTCVGSGCQRPSQTCHIDHTVAWAEGGCTCDGNLGPLCLACHKLKHLCGWILKQPEPGHFYWLSPVGQRHDHLPEPIFDYQIAAA